jgi:hypothetical protein
MGSGDGFECGSISSLSGVCNGFGRLSVKSRGSPDSTSNAQAEQSTIFDNLVQADTGTLQVPRDRPVRHKGNQGSMIHRLDLSSTTFYLDVGADSVGTRIALPVPNSMHTYKNEIWKAGSRIFLFWNLIP